MNPTRLSLIAVILSLIALINSCQEAESAGPSNDFSYATFASYTTNVSWERYETNDCRRFVLTLELKQSHLILDIGKHLKDAMNKVTFDIPVDKAFYDAVEEGTVLNKDFRVGSFIMEGSFGNWKVTVKSKKRL